MAVTAAGAVEVDSLQARPSPFTPNGDGVTDTTTLSFFPRAEAAAESVVARVTVTEVATSTPVDTLMADVTIPVNVTVDRVWDPGPIVDGAYRFDVQLTDGPDSATGSIEVTADSTPPSVTFGSVAPDPFDPGSAPPGDSLRVPFTVASDSVTVTTVVIRQIVGSAADTLGTFTGSGSGEFTWGGLLPGTVSPVSAVYEAFAYAVDLAGNTGSDSRSFILDADAPEFVFGPGYSDTTQTSSLSVTISGLVTDAIEVDSVLVSFDDTTFVPVDSMSAPADTVYFEVIVDTGPMPGFQDVTIRAWDIFGNVEGHRTDHVQVIAYDTAFPMVDSTIVLNENAEVFRGDTLRVRTYWNSDSLTMLADLSRLDSDFGTAAPDEYFENEGGGRYLLTYPVSLTNSRGAGTKSIMITASTPYLTGTDTVEVTLREGRASASQLLYIDKNKFDPQADEVVTFSSESASTVIQIEIYNLAGRLVRTLKGEGFVTWDGTSLQNRKVASGIYFLRVRADDEEEFRKVAVVRGGGRP